MSAPKKAGCLPARHAGWRGGEPEADRLGVIDLSEADPQEVWPEVAAALEAIKLAQWTSREAPAKFRAPMSELAAQCLADKQRDPASRFTQQTVVQTEAVFRLFRDHIKDAPPGTVKPKAVSEFFDKVKQLSPIWGRSKAARAHSLDQLLALHGKGKAGLTNRTLNRYVSSLNGLWEWVERRGEVCGKNPFEGHWSMAKASKSANAPWSDAAFKAVLALAPDSGEPGRPDLLHWLPRIALLSAMRLNEICALERGTSRLPRA